MANEFGRAEPDGVCPVPLDKLGQLYRSDPDDLMEMIREMPEDRRIRLAVFCYSRAHLRDVGLSIAAVCDAARLAEMAGMVGQVMAAQCRSKVRTFGPETGSRPAFKTISLAGSVR